MKSFLTQHRTKQKRMKVRKFFLRFGIFFVLATGSMLFLLLSPQFQFGHVTLSGNISVTSEDIMRSADRFLSERVAWFFPQSNVLLFGPHTFEGYILQEFPRLASADVTRSFSRELTLDVSERSPWGIYCKMSTDDCFYMKSDYIRTKDGMCCLTNVQTKIAYLKI